MSTNTITAHLRRTQSKTPRISQASNNNRYELIKDRLIERHVSACLILNADEQIVQLYSRAADYLTQPSVGAATTSVHTLIALELKKALSSALVRAKTTSEIVRCAHLPYTLTDRSTYLTLIVHCHRANNLDVIYFSVVILDENLGASHADAPSVNLSEQARQHISMLENRP